MFELLLFCIPVPIIGMIVRYRAIYHPRVQGSISPSETLSSLEAGQDVKREIVDGEPSTLESTMNGVSDLTDPPTLLRIAKKVWNEDVRLLVSFSFTLFK